MVRLALVMRRLIAQRIELLATLAEKLVIGWAPQWIAWPLTILATLAPLAIAFPLGSPHHQIISAGLIAWGLLGFVASDRWLAGISWLGCAFLFHCITAVLLTVNFPDHCQLLFPGANEYWAKQEAWITTGKDPEYELTAWLSAHVQLILGSSLFSLTSLGVTTFVQGLFEVDLMNYYVGRLILRSDSTWIAVSRGWHTWSILRGLGFLFLTFEIVSLGYWMFTGTNSSSAKLRIIRSSIGIGFLIADGVCKYLILDSVRQELFANLAN